jgi:endoglucanase
MLNKFKLRPLSILILLAILVLSTVLPIHIARAINTPWLSVSGRYIKDPAGNTVILRGVSLVDVSVADSRTRNARQLIDMATDSANGWYARVVRLPVYPNAIDGQPGWIASPDAYFNNHLNPAIQECIARQIYCIVDWHYISDYNSSTIDTTTRNFWSYVAPKYANTPNVIFELYNEPVNPDNWSTWKATAQPWVNLIRASAPNNLILIGGPRWSQNVAEAATNPFTGSNLAYVAHIYPEHGGQNTWDSWFGNSSSTVPYFITEWGYQQGGNSPTNGTQSGFGNAFSAYLDTKAVSWTAWVFDDYWQPVMFDINWNLLSGDGYMGQFTKDFLSRHQNDNLPGNGGPTNTPTRTVTPTLTTVTPTRTPTQTVTPTRITPTPSRTPTQTVTPTGTTPTPTRTPTRTVTATQPPGATCTVAYSMNDWGSGFTANVVITNNSSTAVNGWTLTWTFPGNQKITNLWNGSYTQSGTSVSVTNLGYNANIPAGGGSVNFGFNANYSGTNAKPTNFKLNGTACQ